MKWIYQLLIAKWCSRLHSQKKIDIKYFENHFENLDELKFLNTTSKISKINELRKSGMAGMFAASLELAKEGLIRIMQKKSFDRLLIKERKWINQKI